MWGLRVFGLQPSGWRGPDDMQPARDEAAPARLFSAITVGESVFQENRNSCSVVSLSLAGCEGRRIFLNRCELYLGFPSADRLLLIGLKVYWFLFLSSLFHFKRLFWRFKEKKKSRLFDSAAFCIQKYFQCQTLFSKNNKLSFLKYNFIYFWLCWVLVAAQVFIWFQGETVV